MEPWCRTCRSWYKFLFQLCVFLTRDDTWFLVVQLFCPQFSSKPLDVANSAELISSSNSKNGDSVFRLETQPSSHPALSPSNLTFLPSLSWRYTLFKVAILHIRMLALPARMPLLPFWAHQWSHPQSNLMHTHMVWSTIAPPVHHCISSLLPWVLSARRSCPHQLLLLPTVLMPPAPLSRKLLQWQPSLSKTLWRYPAHPFFQSEGFQILSALQASLMIMMLASSKKFLAIQASVMVLLLTTRKFLSLLRWSWFQMLTWRLYSVYQLNSCTSYAKLPLT